MKEEKHSFWGKLVFDQTNNQLLETLSLENHCIDVSSVFRELCERPSIKRGLELAAGQRFDAIALDRLAVFCFYHDLGKANWGFYNKRDPRSGITAGHTRETAPLFFNQELSERFCRILDCERLGGWLDQPESLSRLLTATISHHGQPVFSFDAQDETRTTLNARFWQPAGQIDPMTGLKELADACCQSFPDAFHQVTDPIRVTTTLEHQFAGLVMLSDWLGSHREAFFPFRHEGERRVWARRQAQAALSAVGLDVSAARNKLSPQPPFSQAFGFDPYPLQKTLYEAGLPNLLIAESDTGSGKTEAALGHFIALLAEGKVDSLYFALPTRVAARELYGRVLEYMKNIFETDCPQVLLAVPGYVHLDGEPADKLPGEKNLWHDEKQWKQARCWSAERPKRFLAAPVAIGTIDQALLSAIMTPHAHLRRVCLNRSLLVIDEVHSSEAYMRALSRQMLAHHLSVGGHALLLSATLGSAARMEYLFPDVYPLPEPYEKAIEIAYPALCGPGMAIMPCPYDESRVKQVEIDPVEAMEYPEGLLPRLKNAVRSGQRILVVMNTVTRAIALTRLVSDDPELAAVLFTCNGIPCPHHGRFARTDRELLDKSVSRRLGKNSPPGAVLLIGTQTLEQSLDIDADWLIADLCPIDVLLQRIGRLHRHDRGNRPRPVCTVLLPQQNDLSEFLSGNGDVRYGVPAGLGSVYEDLRILQLTRDLLTENPVITLPEQNRYLVETATHPERLRQLTGSAWEAHSRLLEGRYTARSLAAAGALIPDKHFGDFTFPKGLEERLATRLGLNDRRLLLGDHFTSPFGRTLDEINIPGHMAKGLEQERADSVESEGNDILIRVSGLSFRYSRFGLEKNHESTDLSRV